MRYVNLSNLLALRLIATTVEKRFPDYETLVRAKLLLPNEVRYQYTTKYRVLNKYFYSLVRFEYINKTKSIL